MTIAGVLCLVLNMSWAQERKDEVPMPQDVRQTIPAADSSTLIVLPQTIPSLDPPPPAPVPLSAAPTPPPSPPPPPAETWSGRCLAVLVCRVRSKRRLRFIQQLSLFFSVTMRCFRTVRHRRRTMPRRAPLNRRQGRRPLVVQAGRPMLPWFFDRSFGGTR